MSLTYREPQVWNGKSAVTRKMCVVGYVLEANPLCFGALRLEDRPYLYPGSSESPKPSLS